MNELTKVVSEFARAVDQVTQQIPNLELDDVVQLYDDIEAGFLPRVSGSDEATIEFKRRIAESKLYLLCEYNRPFEEVILFYDAVCKYGFADLERKATVDIIFAKYCLRNGYTGRGSEILNQLYQELSDTLTTNDLEIYRHLMKIVERILKEKML